MLIREKPNRILSTINFSNMKIKIFSFILLSAGICFLMVLSCGKNGVRSKTTQPVNMHLVPELAARSMAVAFNPTNFYHSNNPTNHSPYRSTLRGNNSIDREITVNDSFGQPVIYVYNFADQQGALLISADSGVAPVLAYIEHGSFDPAHLSIGPGGLRKWMNKTLDNFKIIRSGLYDNYANAAPAWKKYALVNSAPEGTAVPLSELHHGNTSPANVPVNNPCDKGNTYTTIGPLLPVAWGQWCTYNDQCPDQNCTIGCSTQVPTGCVATAMAQIIRYWSIADSYNFNYASMPANEGSAEVQRLMYAAGKQVGMTYTCSESSAYMTSVPGALQNFGFSSANYNGYGWTDVEDNIYGKEPVILSGCDGSGGTGCHAWVCDGLMDEEYVVCVNGVYEGGGEILDWHMNWGWNEVDGAPNYNGWFQYNNWAPGSGDNFQYFQDMVWNIHP
jgi:hypothetical protein